MKISSALLFDELSARFPVVGTGVSSAPVQLSSPAFYTGEGSIRRNTVYIFRTPDSAPAGAAVVYCDGLLPLSRSGNWISIDAAPEQALNAVSEIFEKYNAWEDTLENILLEKRSIGNLISVSGRILENTVYLLRSDFKVTAQTGESALPAEMQIFNEDMDNFDLVTAFRQSRGYTDHQDSSEPFFLPAGVLPFACLCVNLFRGGSPLGMFMVVESRRKLKSTDAELASVAARYASFLLEHRTTAESSMDAPSVVLYKMLSDMNSDYDSAIRQLDYYGWNNDDNYLCAYFYTEPGKFFGTENDRICLYLRESFPGSCAFIFDNHIVCYFNLTKSGRSIEAFYSEISVFVRDNYMHVGYSRVVHGKNHLRRQFSQARFALLDGMKVHSFKWIFRFDDYIPDFFKEEILKAYPAELVCHPGLLELRRSDIETGTEYMITLRTLLDNNMNTSLSARNLFIHRSTLLYRLDKIKYILDSTLDDPEELLFLSISFRLLDYK